MVSSGVRNLVKLVGGWTFAFGLFAFMVTHFEQIRTHLGLTFTPQDFGMSAPAAPPAPAAQPDDRLPPDYDERKAERPVATRRERARPRARDEDLFRYSASLQRGPDGHFRADAEINGRSIDVLVDTGATLVAMSYEDAVRAGISVGSGDFRFVSNTANGQARFARVTLESVRVGNIVVRNVPAAVSEPGRLGVTLLGMSFLGQLRMEMKNGRLVLEQ